MRDPTAHRDIGKGWILTPFPFPFPPAGGIPEPLLAHLHLGGRGAPGLAAGAGRAPGAAAGGPGGTIRDPGGRRGRHFPRQLRAPGPAPSLLPGSFRRFPRGSEAAGAAAAPPPARPPLLRGPDAAVPAPRLPKPLPAPFPPHPAHAGGRPGLLGAAPGRLRAR